MKRFAALAVLTALLLSLSACGQWVKDEYLSVGTHQEQPLPTQQTEPADEPVVVGNRNELRGAVLSCIRNWTERSTLTVRGYDGDINADLQETLRYVTAEDPIGAFAVDYADAELSGDAKSGTIELSLVFRRSEKEINAIITVNGSEAAELRVQRALAASETALTLRIRDYQDTDYEQYVRRYCIEHPDQVAAIPQTDAQVYPDTGETRILELHFTYPAGRDVLRTYQSETDTIFTSAANYVGKKGTEQERAARLVRFLTTRFAYTVSDEMPTMPAYSLLCEGKANSLSFASVFYAECSLVGVECYWVEGTRGGTEHMWNLVCLDGVYYYVDLMRSVERGEKELTLLTAGELLAEGYEWQQEDFPANPEPSESTEE